MTNRLAASFRFSVLTALLASNVAPALAGIPDSPLPTFSDGKQSVLVLAVPGVVNRGRMETDFFCTSFDSEPVDIGVEIFDSSGTLLNDVTAGVGAVLNVAMGSTVTIGTSGTAAFLETLTIPVATLPQGSARVIATSGQIRCNVVITDDAVSPPASLATLSSGIRPSPGPLPPTIPFPQFSDGKSATHSALIPGAVKRGRMETDLFCTSLSTTNIDIGIEILGTDGTVQNSVAAGNGAILNVAPGTTITFGTTGTASFLESQVISLAGVAQGAARLVTTSAGVACTAFALDSAVAPPTSMTSLTSGSSGR